MGRAAAAALPGPIFWPRAAPPYYLGETVPGCARISAKCSCEIDFYYYQGSIQWNQRASAHYSVAFAARSPRRKHKLTKNHRSS